MYNRMPVFNIFGVDPFDFGESNVANGFCNLGNELQNMVKAMTCEDDQKSHARRPNFRAEHTDEADTFYVELPGVKKEDISVVVSGEYTLALVAQRKVGKTETTFRTELASDKDINNAKLKYEDGLLTITVAPKPKAVSDVKQLQIQ